MYLCYIWSSIFWGLNSLVMIISPLPPCLFSLPFFFMESLCSYFPLSSLSFWDLLELSFSTTDGIISADSYTSVRPTHRCFIPKGRCFFWIQFLTLLVVTQSHFLFMNHIRRICQYAKLWRVLYSVYIRMWLLHFLVTQIDFFLCLCNTHF